MAISNKTCLMCKEQYKYCSKCGEFSHLPKWMNMFHDQGCKDLYDILSSKNHGHLTLEQAREKLLATTLPPIEKLSENVQAQIREIMKQDEIKEIIVSNEKEEIETINESDDIDETIVEDETAVENELEDISEDSSISGFILKKKNKQEK